MLATKKTRYSNIIVIHELLGMLSLGYYTVYGYLLSNTRLKVSIVKMYR